MKTLWIGLIVVAIIAIGGYAFPRIGFTLGGTTNYDIVSAAGLQIGSGCSDSGTTCLGTRVTQLNTGTCSLAASAVNLPFNASSTALFTCTATGVQPGDKVFLTPSWTPDIATSTFSGAPLAGIAMRAASSTAANTITVLMFNNTGAATSSFSQATSSWLWWSAR